MKNDDREPTAVGEPPRRLIFWQNRPSIHQAPLLSALANTANVDVSLITEWDWSAARREQGWENAVYDGVNVTIAPTRSERLALQHLYRADAIHIFSGLGTYPRTASSMRAVTSVPQAAALVFTEPWSPQGPAGSARSLKYLLRARHWRGRVRGILTTGDLAAMQFERAGFRASQIYPFGYFVGTPEARATNSATPSALDRRVHLTLVSQLIVRKGIAALLHALMPIRTAIRLTVIGDGPERDTFRHLAGTLGLSDTVTWAGALPNAMTREAIRQTDALILNSSFDGWGAVVNEALLAGTPALVSTRAGSSQLIANPRLGITFDATDTVATTDALRTLVARVHANFYDRDYIRGWARGHISPEVAAQYLLDVVGHAVAGVGAAPKAPWLS